MYVCCLLLLVWSLLALPRSISSCGQCIWISWLDQGVTWTLLYSTHFSCSGEIQERWIHQKSPMGNNWWWSLTAADAPRTSGGGNEVRVLTRKVTSPAEKAATCLSAALLTAYHPSCKLVATTCLVSLLFISFTFVRLLAQFLRQEHYLLQEGGVLGLLIWENLETQMSVLYKSYMEMVLRLCRQLLWAWTGAE